VPDTFGHGNANILIILRGKVGENYCRRTLFAEVNGYCSIGTDISLSLFRLVCLLLATFFSKSYIEIEN